MAKDLEKRKRVMQRSMQLGHCVCDPKKPCPCDTLRQQDVCPCAGERLELAAGPVRLTQSVESAGCASKIDQATLAKVLQGLPSLDDPRVLVGMPAGDDAGVFQLDDGMALVQTVDVFSPSVDDPYTFGQVAAANSLSDVYAMGGHPITALSIVGFPARAMPDHVMREILRGGIDKMTEAGVAVIGGHSIRDNEIKAGFAVTGLIDPARIVTNAAARPGDRLVLTKPLGTGILAFAAQIGRAPAGGPEAAARSMTALNKRAAERMIEFGAHACTDVTGFGLMGHLAAMGAASKVDVEIVFDHVPLLPGVRECAAQGILPGAIERNRESSGHALAAADGVPPAMLDILFDAQTSGGLLIAVPEAAADALVARLREDGISEAAVIGRVLAVGTGRVVVRAGEKRGTDWNDQAEAQPGGPVQETSAMSCCEQGGSAAFAESVAGEAQQKFHEFMKTASAPGKLDARAKRAVSVALSVLARCEPCLKIHIHKAREAGLSQEEIDEAAWMAVAFGGCSAMMFYKEVSRGA
jgi:selenide,water dikinase